MEVLGPIITGLGLLIGVPIALFFVGGAVHFAAFVVLPETWESAGRLTANPLSRGLLAGAYAALIMAFLIALADAGCARAIG